MSHPAVTPAQRVLLDEEQVRRTLSRIAHEIIERNDDLDDGRARRDPHARRAARAAPAPARRGALGRRARARPARHHLPPRRRPRPRRAARRAAPQPRRARHEARLRARGPHRDPRRRRPLHGPHDPRRDRRAVRVRPARRACSSPCSPTAATASCRSAPTTSARTCRRRAASASRSSCSRSTRSTASCSSPSARRRAMMTDLRVVGGDLVPPRDRAPAPALDRRPRPRRRRAPARDRALVRAVAGARDEEAADAARPARRQRLLRVVDAHVVVVRARGEAPLGRHADAEVVRLVGRQGRVAEGHGADAVGVRPGRDRPPPSRGRRARSSSRATTDAHVVNAGDGKHQHPTQALLDLYTMREAFGRLEGLHVAIVGDVLHSRVARSLVQALQLVGAERCSSARRRWCPRARAGRRTTSTRSPTPTSSTSCACSASGCSPGANFVPSLREYTRALGHHARARCAPGQRVMHPGPMNRGVEIDPRVADSRRGARRRPGAGRARRAHGGALRPAHDRARSRSRPRWGSRDARRAPDAAPTTSSIRGARVLDPGRGRRRDRSTCASTTA